MKLNTLLAKTDALSKAYQGMVADFLKFFKQNQGAFKGEKRTYRAKEGYLDEPSKRGLTLVQTTVAEKFSWFRENAQEYIDLLFSQEATNASGNVKTELVVEGNSWGEFSSLELLRLKSLLEQPSFVKMLENIPVRSDADDWYKSEQEVYKDRNIWEQPRVETIERTTIKESYILPDPNLEKGAENYTPQVALKHNTVEIGESTRQIFSGEISHRQRAIILKKRHTLYVAVIEALKVCNETEAVPSNMSAEILFNYLLKDI